MATKRCKPSVSSNPASQIWQMLILCIPFLFFFWYFQVDSSPWRVIVFMRATRIFSKDNPIRALQHYWRELATDPHTSCHLHMQPKYTELSKVWKSLSYNVIEIGRTWFPNRPTPMWKQHTETHLHNLINMQQNCQ